MGNNLKRMEPFRFEMLLKAFKKNSFIHILTANKDILRGSNIILHNMEQNKHLNIQLFIKV